MSSFYKANIFGCICARIIIMFILFVAANIQCSKFESNYNEMPKTRLETLVMNSLMKFVFEYIEEMLNDLKCNEYRNNAISYANNKVITAKTVNLFLYMFESRLGIL